jgi:transposase-like protein
MKQTPRQTAYNLYFQTNLTQAQIAERAGISTRTLYDWMKQGNWKTLKANSRLMPAQIVDDIYNHISHLNWKIKTRDFEDRYPSKEEAETLRKLISTIPKIKLNVSKGESAQAMVNFVSWLQTRNNDAAIFISDFIDEYLHAGREKGLEPYEFEYDADQYYNPEDYPWRKEHTFEQRVSEEQKSSPPYFQGGVPAEPNDALAGGGGSPLAQEDQQKPEPNQNQIGSKSEVPQQPPNPPKPNNNQPPNLKKLPDLASGNKKRKKEDEPLDPNDPDFVQKVFASWQKEIDKSKRRRRY